MKSLTSGLIVLLLALAACSEGNLAGMEETTLHESALSAGKSDVKMVPVKGSWNYVVDPDGTPVPCYIPGNPTPVTTMRTNRLLATGDMSHLGETTSIITVDACLVNAAGGYLQATGTNTITAANGDAMNATWVGAFYANGRIDFTIILFTGGTGRFEGVEGWASGAGQQTPEGGTYWAEGMISSVASIK